MRVIEQMPMMCLAESVLVSVLHACTLLIAQPLAALLRSVFPMWHHAHGSKKNSLQHKSNGHIIVLLSFLACKDWNHK